MCTHQSQKKKKKKKKEMKSGERGGVIMVYILYEHYTRNFI